MTPPPIPASPRKQKSGCLIAVLILGGLALGLVVVLAIIGSILPKPKRTDYVNAPKTTAGEAADPVQPSTLAWSEISAIYGLKSKDTDLARDEKWKAYKGFTIQWTGTVVDVSKDLLGDYLLSVKMNPDTFSSDVSVKLKKDQVSPALQLKKGDKVTYQARLVNWGSLLPITADEGVIVH